MALARNVLSESRRRSPIGGRVLADRTTAVAENGAVEKADHRRQVPEPGIWVDGILDKWRCISMANQTGHGIPCRHDNSGDSIDDQANSSRPEALLREEPMDQPELDSPRTLADASTIDAAIRRLDLARSPADRQQAVSMAIQAGVPLWIIGEYLDWLDSVQVNVAKPKRKAGFAIYLGEWLAQKWRPLVSYLHAAPTQDWKS
jgi:hypothetical protein